MTKKPESQETDTQTAYASRYHLDGTITYWSVYDQVTVARADPRTIPDREWAAMSETELVRLTDLIATWPPLYDN